MCWATKRQVGDVGTAAVDSLYGKRETCRGRDLVRYGLTGVRFKGTLPMTLIPFIWI